jgi:hypothetical protein
VLELGCQPRLKSSRSYARIVRANALAVFSVILAGFGAVIVEQNDEWLVQRRYLSDHSIR